MRQRCTNSGGAVIFSREQRGYHSSSVASFHPHPHPSFFPSPSKQKSQLQGQGKLPVSSGGCPPRTTPQEGFPSFPFGSRGTCRKLSSPSHLLQRRLRGSSRQKSHSGPSVAAHQNISCSLSLRVWVRILVVSMGLCLISPLHAAAECWPGMMLPSGAAAHCH